jgi:hypothetical protein
MKRITHGTAIGVALAALGACGSGMSGTYQDPQGLTRYEFRSGNTVLMTVMGTTLASDYRLDDDKIFITSPQGTLVLSRTRDRDALDGPMGLKLRRVTR